MIKVCHLSSVHDRYDSRIFQKECYSLAKAGYEITYIVNDKKKNEHKNGVKIISTGLFYKNRILRILFTIKVLKQMAIRQNADIYHFHDPELIPVGLYLKKKGKIVIDDVHEDVPRDVLSKEWIPKIIRKIISYVIEKYEADNLDKFDALFSVTPFLIERLNKINPNTFLVTNYPLTNQENNNRSLEDYLKQKNIICFTGAITSAWQHENILQAIEDIDCIYVLAGKTTKSYLDSLKKHHSWRKVEYKGVVTHKDVRKIFDRSTVGIAIADYRPGAGYKKGTLGNTKLFEYMQAGLPVVCTDFISWKSIIEKYNCGICVSPYDNIAIKNAILFLLQNKKEAFFLGQNGIKAIKDEFNWNIQEKILLEVYDKLCKLNLYK